MLTGAIEGVLESEVEGVLKGVVKEECVLEGGGSAGELLGTLL